MNKNVLKFLIFIVIIMIPIIIVSYKIFENNRVMQPIESIYSATAIEQQMIVNAVEKYGFVDKNTMSDMTVNIVDKDSYNRYLVKIEYTDCNEQMGYFKKGAYIVIYDVKEDGTSKTDNSSLKFMGIVGATNLEPEETIKEQYNWNKPLK